MEEFLSKYTIGEELVDLPLLHTTKVLNLNNIIDNDCLSPTKIDKLFNEELLFFFYGRAAYSIHWEDKRKKNTLQSDECPIIFMFNYDDIYADHIFAFDTGGYVNNNYKDKYAGACEIGDVSKFNLGNKENLKKMIDFCYTKKGKHSKNYSYYSESPILSADCDNDVIKRYIECLQNGKDKRCKTPEISTTKKVLLELCKVVLAPCTLLEDEKNQNKWKEYLKIFALYGITVEYYYPFGEYDSDSLSEVASAKLNEILAREGYTK